MTSTPARASRPKYNAFISYSHAADGEVAPALQHALHRLARPWYRLRALHVFRDQTNLAVNPDLWSGIVKARPIAEIRHHKTDDRTLSI